MNQNLAKNKSTMQLVKFALLVIKYTNIYLENAFRSPITLFCYFFLFFVFKMILRILHIWL